VPPCPVCGLDEAAIALPDAVVILRSYPRRWRAVIDAYRSHDGDAILTARPEPETWSALEYGAHTRDVFRLLDAALEQVLVKDTPRFPVPPTPDEVAASYGNLDADTVLNEFSAASVALADRASGVSTGDWGRTFFVGDNEHTVAWIVQHAAHEGSHHLRDISRGLAALTGHEHAA